MTSASLRQHSRHLLRWLVSLGAREPSPTAGEQIGLDHFLRDGAVVVMAHGIPLMGRGDLIRAFAVIDPLDRGEIESYRWNLISRRYAGRRVEINGKRGVVYLHRQLMGLTHGEALEVDHINGNTLDNRRSNLRVVTHALNMQNYTGFGKTSPHRGVSWDTRRRKWQAQASVNRKKYRLGHFDDEAEAARVASNFRAEHMPGAVEPPDERRKRVRGEPTRRPNRGYHPRKQA